ncbi:subclass B1 metallo-beta-lactamase [Flagellimonas sp.]|uniref:subclass B1 metallo-beta-lactamase n=1 Tax=Flagellimonas sp. TaxID=2058762 RepID=UPI003B5086CC
MIKALFFLPVLVLLSGCSNKNRPPTPYESETLKVLPLNSNVFRHVSYLQTNDFGKVGCNGMVYFNHEEAIVFDTPTDDKASKELIEWIEKKQKKKVVAVVVTHFHEDCWGGLHHFHDSQVSSYGSQNTIDLLEKKGLNLLPQQDFNDSIKIKVGQEQVVLKYFGAGHTQDNVVGYIRNEEALFGGCLVKSVGSGKGNLEDADVSEWPNTVQKIKQEFPHLKIVIPGHGKSGGMELLDHTIQLFE